MKFERDRLDIPRGAGGRAGGIASAKHRSESLEVAERLAEEGFDRLLHHRAVESNQFLPYLHDLVGSDVIVCRYCIRFESRNLMSGDLNESDRRVYFIFRLSDKNSEESRFVLLSRENEAYSAHRTRDGGYVMKTPGKLVPVKLASGMQLVVNWENCSIAHSVDRSLGIYKVYYGSGSVYVGQVSGTYARHGSGMYLSNSTRRVAIGEWDRGRYQGGQVLHKSNHSKAALLDSAKTALDLMTTGHSFPAGFKTRDIAKANVGRRITADIWQLGMSGGYCQRIGESVTLHRTKERSKGRTVGHLWSGNGYFGSRRHVQEWIKPRPPGVALR